MAPHRITHPVARLLHAFADNRHEVHPQARRRTTPRAEALAIGLGCDTGPGIIHRRRDIPEWER